MVGFAITLHKKLLRARCDSSFLMVTMIGIPPSTTCVCVKQSSFESYGSDRSSRSSYWYVAVSAKCLDGMNHNLEERHAFFPWGGLMWLVGPNSTFLRQAGCVCRVSKLLYLPSDIIALSFNVVCEPTNAVSGGTWTIVRAIVVERGVPKTKTGCEKRSLYATFFLSYTLVTLSLATHCVSGHAARDTVVVHPCFFQ